MTINGTLAAHRYPLIVKVNASYAAHFTFTNMYFVIQDRVSLILLASEQMSVDH